MARNRQRAKQRQAERRARRLGEQGGDRGAAAEARPAEPTDGLADPTAVEPSPAVDPHLAVGAPPEDLGRSDEVLEDEPWVEERPGDEEEAVSDEEEALREPEGGDGQAPRGRRRAAEAAPARDRPRFVQFLYAVWAELQRVQWPNRQALTTLTGVVLGFVLIAGGYLGLLDAIFSRLVQAIL